MPYARIELRLVTEDGEIIDASLPTSTPSTEAMAKAASDWLVATALQAQAIAQAADRAMGICKVELKRRMEVDRATVYKSAAGTAEIKTTNIYDPNTLDAVLELLPQQEFEQAGALVPEYDETITIKRKWNVTKLRPFKKRNADIDDIIERAKRIGSVDVVVKPNDK